MPPESLLALVTLAGYTVVSAATTDAWEEARSGFAQLLGHGDLDRTEVAERQLAETHEQLNGAGRVDLEQIRAAMAEQWAGRLADLLEEHPDVEVTLRTLVQEIQGALPNGIGIVSAADHGVAAGRDVNITASGGIAAGVIHGGPVAAPGSWEIGPVEPGAIAAVHGGVAIGHLQLPQQQTMTSQPVRLAPRPVFLVGREELLAELNTRLTEGDDSAPRIVALSGLGGAGKSSVAVEYAYRHLAEVGVAWQFAAEDVTVLAAGFGELAAQLGARDLVDARDPVASVHAVLASFPAPWLLIFDNAADMGSVAAFLPPAGPGQVLITSQNPNWPGQPLTVPMLDPEVAAGFLASRTGDPDLQAARELARELGGLPLALEQAASYLQAAGDTLAGYLALFRLRRADLLARGEPTGYSKTVASTWALAFERLQTEPGAVGLLRLLAFCAPDAIPLRLLLQTRPGLAGQLGGEVVPILIPLLEDTLTANRAIVALRRFSLITTATDGSVSVPRLIQAVTIDQMPVALAEEWRQATAAVIEAAIPNDVDWPQTWPDFAVLLSHAQAALTPESLGMSRIANYLGKRGNYAAARELNQRALEVLSQTLGPEHLETLVARYNVAQWIGEAGDAAEARDQFKELLADFQRVLGSDHRTPWPRGTT
jgi:hypothetical protein